MDLGLAAMFIFCFVGLKDLHASSTCNGFSVGSAYVCTCVDPVLITHQFCYLFILPSPR